MEELVARLEAILRRPGHAARPLAAARQSRLRHRKPPDLRRRPAADHLRARDLGAGDPAAPAGAGGAEEERRGPHLRARRRGRLQRGRGLRLAAAQAAHRARRQGRDPHHPRRRLSHVRGEIAWRPPGPMANRRHSNR